MEIVHNNEHLITHSTHTRSTNAIEFEIEILPSHMLWHSLYKTVFYTHITISKYSTKYTTLQFCFDAVFIATQRGRERRFNNFIYSSKR